MTKIDKDQQKYHKKDKNVQWSVGIEETRAKMRYLPNLVPHLVSGRLMHAWISGAMNAQNQRTRGPYHRFVENVTMATEFTG